MERPNAGILIQVSLRQLQEGNSLSTKQQNVSQMSPEVVFPNMKEIPITRQPCLLIDANGRQIAYVQRIKGCFLRPKYNLPFPFLSIPNIWSSKLTSNRSNTSKWLYRGENELNESGIERDFLTRGGTFAG